jgi:membrane-anchored mycosin MYCP
MRFLPRVPLYAAAVAMAAAGTVLSVPAPVQAQDWTTPTAGDEQVDCNPPPPRDESLTASSWARDFIAIDEAHQYNQGTFEDGSPVVIAVIDTGVQATLTDVFGDRVLSGFDPWDPDAAGRCDAYGHGSAAAALAAGAADGEQFIGVAPEADILPLRAYQDREDGGSPEKSDLVASLINDAVSHDADVINISLALPDTPDLEQAVKDAVAAGVVIVAATGNDQVNMDDPSVEADNQAYYPANYPEVIAVGGNSETGTWYGKTNFGENLDLLAPGVEVALPASGGGWYTDSGTSYAAPFVAGAAALLKGHFGKDTPVAWIEQRLRATAIHPPNNFNVYQGYGVLNVGNAMTAPLDDYSDLPTGDASPDPTAEPGGEPSSIAAVDIDYDPLAFEKTVAWASVGGSVVLIALVLVLRKVIPKGRSRRWRPGSREVDRLPVKTDDV